MDQEKGQDKLLTRPQLAEILSERGYPLSGACNFRGSSHDIDLYLFGRDEAPAVAEVKGRKNGAGFATLGRWRAEYDRLLLRHNNADPLVLLPWRMCADMVQRVRL